MKKDIQTITLSERVCLNLNKLFKPKKDLENLRNNPTRQSRAEYSVQVGINHFEKSVSHIKEWQNKDILDLGCGYGGLISALQDKGCRTTTGMDLDANAVTEARRYVYQAKENAAILGCPSGSGGGWLFDALPESGIPTGTTSLCPWEARLGG